MTKKPRNVTKVRWPLPEPSFIGRGLTGRGLVELCGGLPGSPLLGAPPTLFLASGRFRLVAIHYRPHAAETEAMSLKPPSGRARPASRPERQGCSMTTFSRPA